MNQKQKTGLLIIRIMPVLYTCTLLALLLCGNFFPSNAIAYAIGFFVLLVFIIPIPMAIVWVKVIKEKKGFVRILGAYFVFFAILLGAIFVATIIVGYILAILFDIFH